VRVLEWLADFFLPNCSSIATAISALLEATLYIVRLDSSKLQMRFLNRALGKGADWIGRGV